jgi:hypothetical protein
LEAAVDQLERLQSTLDALPFSAAHRNAEYPQHLYDDQPDQDQDGDDDRDVDDAEQDGYEAHRSAIKRLNF